MRLVLKIVGGLVAAILLLAGAGIAFLSLKKPAQRPASTEKVEATPARLARGEYLVKHVSDCLHCHSEFDLASYTAPEVPGTEGQGGYPFDERLGIPGMVQAQNITADVETGIGGWTDGEVLRAFREGVKNDGTALFPMMPYENFASMSDEDAKSILVYIRTLKPVKHAIAPRRLNPPMSFIVKFIPQPLSGPVTAPDDAKDHAAYAKYVTTVAGCIDCHTPRDDKGKPLKEEHAFEGGWTMTVPFGRVTTANLTGVEGSFMAQATKEEFIGRFKAFEGQDPHSVKALKGRNTVMAWYAYAGMTEQDLGAIYDYLKTLKPRGTIHNPFPDAEETPVAAGTAN
jgi:hypothetical protein